VAERVMPITCPGCHKAEPLVKTEWTRSVAEVGIAVSVTIPISLCGRCGIKISQAALDAAMKQLATIRR